MKSIFRTIISGFFFTVFLLFGFSSPCSLSAQTGTITAASIAAMPVGTNPAWNRDVGAPVIGQPYLQVESAVLAGSTGGIKSFYMTGTTVWDFDPEEKLTPYIARSIEGATYISDSAGYFRAVNRIGRELWRINLEKPMDFKPVVGWDGRIFIPVGSQIHCRTGAGYSLWVQELGSPITVAPVLDRSGGIATVLQNREFVRISPYSALDRVRLDRQPLLIVSVKSTSEESYVLFYSAGETEKIVFNENGSAGRRLTRYTFPSLPMLAVSVVGREDRFAVTLADGRVQCINISGNLLWSDNSHESAIEKGSGNLALNGTDMIFDERGIYVLSTKGTTGFASDGRRRFIFKFEEAASMPSLSDEGLLYVPRRDNHLYVYKLDSKPRTAQRSRFYGYEPEGNYGLGSPPPSPWAIDDFRYDSNEQNRMLHQIEAAVNSGQIGEDEPVYTAYLHEMIGFFLNDPHYSRVRPKVNPVQRVYLIRLLGRIGSRDTVPFLWHIFDRDEEPSIKAACAEAIGRIGVDITGRTFVSFNFFLTPNNPTRDPQLLMSATSAIAALCRFSGPPLSHQGILLLRYFSNLTWAPNIIKNQIKNEIDALYKEGLDTVLQ